MREEQAGEGKGGSWAPACDAEFGPGKNAHGPHTSASSRSASRSSSGGPLVRRIRFLVLSTCSEVRRAEVGLVGTCQHWHVIAQDTMTLRSGGCAHGRGGGRTGTSSPPGAHLPSGSGARTAEESAFRRGVAGMARERPRDGHQGKASWREVRSRRSTLKNAQNAHCYYCYC